MGIVTYRKGRPVIKKKYLINHFQSAKEAKQEDVLDALDNDPGSLSEDDIKLAIGLRKGLDPDANLEEELAAFVSDVKTRDQMYRVYNDYSDPAWMLENTRAFVIAMCSTLVALSKKFGFPPREMWSSFDIHSEQA